MRIEAGPWPRVYVSTPITLGDPEHNFNQAARAQLQLQLARFAVLNPALTMKLPWNLEISHADWLQSCLPWVAVAQVVLRLPGVSDGADEECAYAVELGIRTYTNIDDLIADRTLIMRATRNCPIARTITVV